MRFSSWGRLRSAITTIFLTGMAVLAPAQENIWTSHGPTGVGLVYDVAFSDSAAYAATTNGVFRSRDGGATWQQSGLAGEWITQILVPAGTAVVLAKSMSGLLYATRDDAEFWAPVPAPFPVTVAAVHPGQPSTVYAGVDSAAIWKSTDAGSSWHRVSATPGGWGPLDFAFNSRAIYVRAFDYLDNLYKFYESSDDGVSWAPIPSPIPYATALAAGAASGIVYTGGVTKFCRSGDSAATWTCSNFPEYPLLIVEVPDDSSGAGPRILAASAGGVYVSRDQGATWARGDGKFGSVGYIPALASDASGSVVLAGSIAGILRSQDRGDSWTPSRAGLRSSLINALALDPQDPSTVWAGGLGLDGENSGLFRSTDGGLSWSLGSGPATWLSGGALLVDPEHPSTLYAGGSDVYRSDDGGAHWTTAAVPGNGITALALDPGSPDRVWAASHAGLFRSDDGAQSFTTASAVAQEVYSILFDARRPSTIYAGSYYDIEPGYYGYPFGGSLFVSRDGGANWTKNSRDVGSPVYAIATDPFQEGVLYAGTYAGVFRSANDGTSWEWPASGLPNLGRVISLVADPVRPGRLYAATESGVYRTIDGARTWQPFSSGLGSLHVQPLVITPDGKWLHAGTDGGGIFELNLETELSSLPCTQTATRLCLVGNRYAVELAAHRGEGPGNPGTARPLSDRAGYFSLTFATGDSQLPEVVVKMLADGAFGTVGAPIFYSSLTTLPYVFTVTDTVTGRVEVYASNADAPLCGRADLTFGAEASVQRLSAPAPVGETDLQLLAGRFSVTLEARHPRTGQVAHGVTMSSGDRFGFFSLPDFTGDPQFPEVVVKMVDYRAITDKFWFFHTSLTSLDYTLTVTDSVTGAVRTYENTTPFCGGADTDAFTD